MAIYNLDYLQESNKYYNGNGKSQFSISKEDHQTIKNKVNKYCKEIYNASEKYQKKINKIPKFGKFFNLNGYCYIDLSGIAEDDYDNGYGLDFQDDVCKKLNRDVDLKKYKFGTQDYPGIQVEMK